MKLETFSHDPIAPTKPNYICSDLTTDNHHKRKKAISGIVESPTYNYISELNVVKEYYVFKGCC